MTVEIIIQVILLGIALSMDAFAVSVTDGLIYTDLNKKRIFLIAFLFGLMQGLMPLTGYYIVELVRVLVGNTAGEEASKILATVVIWISFSLLIFIGGKMLIEAIKDIKKPIEEKKPKPYSFKEVFIMSFAVSIDALASGIAMHAGISSNSTIWIHVSIIIGLTFVISLIGLLLGKAIYRLFKGKYEITSLIGGIILIALAIWVVVSHYSGL